MAKAELREILKKSRADFADAAAPFVDSRQIAHMPAQLDRWITDAQCVSAYLPMGSEVDPLPLLRFARENGCTTALPHVTRRQNPMRFLSWNPGDPLEDGPIGLRQPGESSAEVAPDLILTPLLGFDRSFNRLGYGAGFYDRAFAALPNARRVGLAWSIQEVPNLPAEHWDVPLHAIWTEREWISDKDIDQ